MRVALIVAALLALVPAAGAMAPDAVDRSDAPETVVAECSPPCGEINPRLVFSFPELTREPIALTEGESKTFQGQLTFWADTDDEGYSPRDPQEPIVVRFSFPRLPDWAEMSVEPNEFEVPVNTCPTCFNASADDPSQPATAFEYTEEIELTVTVTDTPQPTPGYDYGKLQLFSRSTESGIYNPGYGIREVRISTGDAALQANSADTDETPATGAVAVLATLAAVGAALARRRR